MGMTEACEVTAHASVLLVSCDLAAIVVTYVIPEMPFTTCTYDLVV